MGEVYRAEDPRLNRHVAIKVLPEAFALDAERLARFTREAQSLAALSHPNIAAVFGVEETSGTRALVMELVEGQDLSVRIARGRLPLDEALPIARQIAEALEAAHEAGIIHRDLKPANIKIKSDGGVKVLDFGLAKAMDAAPSDPAGPSDRRTLGPTMTSPALTAMGLILGTAAYMAPEQARGRRVDRRADIWAFGIVLFEMLTGKVAFAGDTVTDVIAAVVTRDPDWTALPADTPDALRRLLSRCLDKDPRRRLRDIGEAGLAVAEIIAAPPDAPGESAQAAPRPRTTRGWMLAVGALAVALTGAGYFAGRSAGPREPGIQRFEIQVPSGTSLRTENRPVIAISPDGMAIAFTALGEGASQLYVRRRDEADARVLAGTEGASNPVFSPDGRWVLFVAGPELKKVSVDGLVVALASVSDPRSAAWLDEATVVFSPNPDRELFTVSAAGGEPKALTTMNTAGGERTHRWPTAMPGGKAVLFTVGNLSSPDNYDQADIDAVIVATGERKRVFRGASMARYVPTGHLLLAREGSLYAVPFDAASLEVSGDIVPVLPGVATDSTTGAAHFDVADDGTLIYLAGGTTNVDRRMFWVTPAAPPEPLPNLPAAVYNDPKISPNGRLVALLTGPSGSGDVWVYDVERAISTRLTFDATNATPAWSEDSRFVYYAAISAGTGTTFWRKPADGSREAEKVAELPGKRAFLQHVEPGGESLLLDVLEGGNTDVVRVPMSTGAATVPLVAGPANEYGAVASPDGRRVVYATTESGVSEIFVRDLAQGGGRWQVSTRGGEEPRWSADGRELFYRFDTRLFSVRVEPGPQFRVGAPRVAVDGIYNLRSDTSMSYDVDPKGARFLMIRPATSEASADITTVRVVLNWLDELREKVR